MFGNGNKAKTGAKTKCSRIDTVIGSQTRLEGDMHFTGGLHVDGVIRGSIIAEPGADAVLTVSEQGRIEGDVRVPDLVLNGEVVGDVHVSNRAELASHARVNGDLYYNLIEMTMGAEINGRLVHSTDAPEAVEMPESEPEEEEITPEAGIAAIK